MTIHEGQKMNSERAMRLVPSVSFVVTVLLATSTLTQALRAQPAPDELAVLDGWAAFYDAPNSLHRTLYKEALRHLESRQREIGKLRSAEDWRGRQQWIRRWLLDQWGPFPERTPLKARVVEVLSHDGFRIEKLFFESVPGFYVTGALLVPDDLQGRVPGILFCSGHNFRAFRADFYQRMAYNLVKKGFVVLAFDPISQGERFQYYEPQTNASRVGPPSREHSYVGAQAFLAGMHVARFSIWDGVRALDYLMSRPEVDPERIGITGNSGGGTQTAFIAAIDERIVASAPQLCMTSTRRLIESMGPQDGEQNFRGSLPAGFDIADLMTVRAPKPVHMIATTRDFFNIGGVEEIFAEAKLAFRALGQAGNLGISMDDGVHEITSKNRAAMNRFFLEALSHPGDPRDEEVDILGYDKLRVTPTGQVSTSLGGKSVHDFVRAGALEAITRLEARRQNGGDGHLADVVAKARLLSGYREPAPVEKSVWTGRHRRDGYSVETRFLDGPDYPLPFLLFLPDSAGPHPAIVYLHYKGKGFEASPGGRIETFVRQGHAVLALDVVGTGELGPGDFKGHSYEFRTGRGSYAIWHLAMHTGRALVGLRAADVVRAVSYLESRDDIDGERIAAIAWRWLGSTLVHAAAFDRRISRVGLVESLMNYEQLVLNRYYAPESIHETVPGSIPVYDLPDLLATLAPRRVTVVDPRDRMRHSSSPEAMENAYELVREVYGRKGQAGAFKTLPRRPGKDNVQEALEELLR